MNSKWIPTLVSVAVLICVIIAGRVGGTPTNQPTKIVAAERFDLVDSHGKIVASLGGGEGWADIAITVGPNENANVVATLSASHGGPVLLRLHDRHQKVQASLGLGDDGTAELLFWDYYGKARAGLGIDSAGSPYVKLVGKDGKPMDLTRKGP